MTLSFLVVILYRKRQMEQPTVSMANLTGTDTWVFTASSCLTIPLVHFSVHTIQGMLWAWVLTEQKRAMSMSLFSQGPIKHSNLKGRLTKKKSTLVSVSVGLLQHNSPQNSCENHSKKLWIIYQFSPCHFRHRLMWMRRALANVLVMKAMISFLYNTIHLYL